MAEFGSLDINELIGQLQETANPVMYQYFKNLNKRTLLITSEITNEDIECTIMPLLEWDNDGTGKEITIYLSTPGGSVYNGLLICDIISQLKTKTTIICLSYAYSMGALILMAGANNPNVTIKCYPFTTALIHGGNTYIEGTTSQVKDFHNFNDKFEERIKKYILEHTKISEEEYDKMERYEWYMDSDEMLKYGLVQEIIN